jgi:hypothetical protein
MKLSDKDIDVVSLLMNIKTKITINGETLLVGEGKAPDDELHLTIDNETYIIVAKRFSLPGDSINKSKFFRLPSKTSLSAAAAAEAEAKRVSKEMALKAGFIAPAKIPGWELQDVPDDGNCFYHAAVLQLEACRHDFLKDTPAGTTHADRLRYYVSGEGAFKDGEWATDETCYRLSCKLKVVVAVIETGASDSGYRYYYSDSADNTRQFFSESEIPVDWPVIRLAATGNHFLSVLSEANAPIGVANASEMKV